VINYSKNKRKLLYKKCLNYKTNIQYKKRILLFKFKKQKWNNYIFFLKRSHKRRNALYKLYDIHRYPLSQTPTLFRKIHKVVLENKQKTNFYYGGLKKKVWKKYVNRISSQKKLFLTCKRFKHLKLGDLLEKRLDIILYRAHFASSIQKARQLIQHSHVNLNNIIATKSSTQLKNNDKITLKTNGKKIVYENLKNSILWPLPPKYLTINYKTFEITFIDFLESSTYSMNFPDFLPNFHLLIKFIRYK